MDKKPRLQTLPYVYFKFFLGYPSLYHLLSTRAYSRGNAKLLECIVPFTTCPFTFSEETMQYSRGHVIPLCL